MTNNDLGSSAGPHDLTSDSRAIAPCVDIEAYAGDLADFDLTDAQKRELLETLWDIMRSLVDLGFDVGEADICGQLFGAFNAASGGAPDGRDHSDGRITANKNDDGGNL